MNFNKQKPKITIHKNNNISYSINFLDRLNIDYDLLQQEFKPLGFNESYSDYVRKNLNPNLDNSNPIYGYGRVLEPKTKTILKMRSNIDNANKILQNNITKQSKNSSSTPQNDTTQQTNQSTNKDTK